MVRRIDLNLERS